MELVPSARDRRRKVHVVRISGRRCAHEINIVLHQMELLAQHFERAIRMLDGDEAGRQGAATIAATIGSHRSVDVIPLAQGAQPDQLSSQHIGAIFHPLGIQEQRS